MSEHELMTLMEHSKMDLARLVLRIEHERDTDRRRWGEAGEGARIRIAELEADKTRLVQALVLIRDQDQPQHPTGTWARDVATTAIATRGER